MQPAKTWKSHVSPSTGNKNYHVWCAEGGASTDLWNVGILPQHYIASFTLIPTQPPIQRSPGTLSLRVKRPKREADHSPPSNAEVKKA
jgi:hypothetical protein